jgi:hypothetical protein
MRLLALVLASAACGTPTADPVFLTTPEIPAVPDFRPVPTRTAPDPIEDQLVLRLERGRTAPDEFDVVNSPGALRGEEGGRPTVIVFAPGVLPDEGRQAIEAALLRRGFAVLDQPGAESDYLFQVDVLEITPSTDRAFRIADRPETRAHVEENPGLAVGDGVNSLPASIPSRWYRARFVARLLDVETGSIVWLGDHELESPAAEERGITIRIDTERRVENEREVNGRITDYNARGARLTEEARELRTSLAATYVEGSQAREFERDEEVVEWQERLRAEAARLEREYRDTLDELASLAAAPPRPEDAPWAFYYEVGAPLVEPDLSPDGAEAPAAQEALANHRARLIRTVVTALIDTILIG